MFINRKSFINFKALHNNYRGQLCLGIISKHFGNTESAKISFKGNVYDFSINSDAIDKSNILTYFTNI